MYFPVSGNVFQAKGFGGTMGQRKAFCAGLKMGADV